MLELDEHQIIVQILGFLVMLWVMKKYGWIPLLEILENRRKKIEGEFDAIAAQKEEVKKLGLEYEAKLKSIDAEARRKIQEGHKMGLKIQEEAHVRAKELLKKTQLEMENELVKVKNQLKNDVVTLVIRTTEKVLHENLDISDQRKLISNFIEEAELK